MVDLVAQVQRIRATVVDHMLEPDAMRGTEHYLRNIKDGEDNPITPVDEEEARRQFQADAVQTRAPIRMSSPQTQTSASETTPPAVPVSEAPGSSPNTQRAPITVGDTASGRTPPVQTDPGVDWQSMARAQGWQAPGESETAPPSTMTPVPNANPAREGSPTPETAPPPTPASGGGESVNLSA